VLAEYDTARGAPVPGEYSKYYTGEAYWALARLHRAFPGGRWGETADRIGAYLATSRDEVEDHWPPVPDHWAAYGQAETVEFPDRGRPPLTEDEADYAREQADLEAPIAERAGCIAGLALDEQSDAEDAAGAVRPDRVEGAWFIDGVTRMDDQQHALAALLRTIPIVEAGSTEDGDGAPSGWLWALALVLALNPARAAFGVPRRSSPNAVELAAVGGVIGGLAVCAAAALGGPLLEALDVSEPSFRLAAGIVAVLAGAADLFRRPPASEPALGGWGAALVPVAIPLVARPALLVLALGVGTDRGVLVSVGALAVALALLFGLAARSPTEGPGGRVLRWAARLLAAALVVCGALLAVDGVLDV
jgi:small neutral amino acid transporter SnatA (MarC family)